MTKQMITESQLKDRIAALQERMSESDGGFQESIEQESDIAESIEQGTPAQQENVDIDMWEGKTSFSQESSLARIIQLSR